MPRLRTLAALLLALPAIAATQTADKPPVEVSGNHLEQTSRCTDGAPMRILANDSRLSVLGSCTTVTIVGSRNWMTVQHARSIVTTGNGNTILYDDRTTRVDDRGHANSVAERWPE